MYTLNRIHTIESTAGEISEAEIILELLLVSFVIGFYLANLKIICVNSFDLFFFLVGEEMYVGRV